MPEEKPDAKEIQEYLATLKKARWLGLARRWWPNYLFHFTDIQNAVKILVRGQLLSRAQLEASGEQFKDAASPDVIEQTDERWKDYVRLYFRPRTPTQYRNEGLRPKSKLELGGAHCPVPIYLLFDSKEVLCRQDTLFSPGNLAAGAEPVGDAKGLKQIRFKQVYHDVWLYPDERSTIIFRRHAEVIVPQRLNLNSLRQICCRSEAEYQTLLYLLPPLTRRRWIQNIIPGAKLNLFFKRWTFVEAVELNAKQVMFRFNKGTSTPGPFHARVEITEIQANDRYLWEDREYSANDVLTLPLHKLRHPEDYTVKLFLDMHLAYAGRYQEESLPS